MEKGAEAEKDSVAEAKADQEANSTKSAPKYNQSLFKALHESFFKRIWIAGFLKLFAGMSFLTSAVSQMLIPAGRHAEVDDSPGQSCLVAMAH